MGFSFLLQFSASCLPESHHLDFETLELKNDTDPKHLNLFLKKIIFFSEDFKPFLYLSNVLPGEKEYERFSYYLETLLKTLLLAFENQPQEAFIYYLEKFEMMKNVLSYEKHLSKHLNQDPKTKLINNKLTDLIYDPCIFYEAHSLVKTKFFEFISQKKKPDMDSVIGVSRNISKWEHLERNTKLLAANAAVRELVTSCFRYFSEKCSQDCALKTIECENLFLFLRVLHIFSQEAEMNHGLSEVITNENNRDCLEAWNKSSNFEEFRPTLKKLLNIFESKIQKKAVGTKETGDVQQDFGEKKAMMKLKQDEIKNQFLLKQENFSKKFIEQFAMIQEAEASTKNEKHDEETYTCVICQSNKNSIVNPLCFISVLQRDSLSQYYRDGEDKAFTNEKARQEYNIILTGCFHTTHMDCCMIKSTYFYCPLCRGYSNYLFPIVSNNFKKCQVAKISFAAEFLSCEINDIQPGSVFFEKSIVSLVSETNSLFCTRFMDSEFSKEEDDSYYLELMGFHSEALQMREISQASKNLNLMRELYLFGRIEIMSNENISKYLCRLQKAIQGFLSAPPNERFKNNLFDFIKLFWKIAIVLDLGREKVERILFTVVSKYLNSLILLNGLSFLSERDFKEASLKYSVLKNSLLFDDAFKYLVFGSLDSSLNLLIGLLSVIYEVDMSSFASIDEGYEKFLKLQEIFGDVFSLNNILDCDKSVDSDTPFDCKFIELSKSHRKNYSKLLFKTLEIGKNYHEFVTAHFFKACNYCHTYPSKSNSKLYLCLICGLCFCDYKCRKVPNLLFVSSFQEHIQSEHCSSSVIISIEDGEVCYVSGEVVFKDSFKKGFLFLNSLGREKYIDDIDYSSFVLDKCLLEKVERDLYERRILEQVFYKK